MARSVCLAGLILAWFACGVAAGQPYPYVVATEPLSPQEQQKLFHLPPGFEIELVVSEPQIHQPLSLDFDAQGRLWITDTVEYPFPPKGPGRDALRVLEDRDGDGRYETVTTLLDDLSMPTGVTPIPGGAIVFSIPSIQGCYDTDGDGQIDRREELYTEFGMVDSHGMNNGFTRWLDGWIYACHGFANTSNVSGADGQPITMSSGNGYRFRLDGSHLEYWWHGQVNPYGIAFDPLGNLFTADCHSKPAYCLLRGAYYPSFGKPHDGLGFGPTLIDHSHGSTAISGIVYYAADQFPPEYRDTIFMGNGVTGKVNHDRITAVGSSLRGIEQPDFVSCDDPWFRPVELKLGPDGALYIADFYNCIIAHYEVPLDHPRRDRRRGRVWRVYYKGTSEEPQQPRKVHDLTRLDLEGLFERLADPNLVVRMSATHEIVDRFGTAAKQRVRQGIQGPWDLNQRACGLWILERCGALDDPLITRLAEDEDRLVRVHLVRAMAEREQWNSPTFPIGDLIRKKLFDADAFVRRAAADALGRHPESVNVALLMRLWSETRPEDTYLVHTIRMALRDHFQQPAIFAEHARLSDDRALLHRLLDVLAGVRDARSAEFILTCLKADRVDRHRMADWIHHVARYLAEEKLGSLADYMLGLEQSQAATQLLVFRAYVQGLQERGVVLPEPFHPWAARLAEHLMADKNPFHVFEGITLAGHLRVESLYDRLAEMAASREQIKELRIAAMDACVATGGSRAEELLDGILADPTEIIEVRSKAARSLSRVNTDRSRQLLLDRLQTAHQRLAVEIAASLAGTRAGADILLEAVGQGKASPQLLQEDPVLHGLQAAKVSDLAARLDRLTEGLPPRDEKIAQLIQQRRNAFLAGEHDLASGKELFEKQCAICHQLSGEGKKFGPDLDGIGNRGLDRLLEDVLDPSRNVDPLFQTTIVITDDGLTHSGLALRDEGKVLILVDADGKEQRIPHDQIDDRFTSPLSPMPNVAEKTLAEPDFPHLLKFLLSITSSPKED